MCVCGLEMHTSPDMILLKASVRWRGLSESFIVRKFSMLKVLRTLPNTYGREYALITFFLLVVVLGSFLSTLNTFIAEEYRLRHELSEYHVYDFMKVGVVVQTILFFQMPRQKMCENCCTDVCVCLLLSIWFRIATLGWLISLWILAKIFLI
jgi:hypothetical protein